MSGWIRRRPSQASIALLGLAAILAVLAGTDTAVPVAAAQASAARVQGATCDLESRGGRVRHVIDVIFDNTHFTRDNPNVPSDLEQMPSLLDFIAGGGTLISHEHTPLIAHTATDILTSTTGLYGDQSGIPISNAFGFYDSGRSASFRSAFAYWTSGLGGSSDNTPYMITAAGRNTPAPWVPYARAGCSVGEVGAANTVLESPRFDIPAVFGSGSPEDKEQKADSARAQADFVGLAVHCGRNATGCGDAQNARADALPAEPGGYQGFRALFGARYLDPVISPNGHLTDLDGRVIEDSRGNVGFPGFDSLTPAVSLAYVAAMQEHGVPVTNAYISDAHDDHAGGTAFGPGQAGYVAALRTYDRAFGEFFARLRKDGIDRSNTLFLFTSDEGDHFVGGAPNPAGCDGVTTPCTYGRIGELDANLSGLLGAVPPYSTGLAVPSMGVHNDSAPPVYVDGNPSQSDPTTRTMERAAKHIQAVSPITDETDHVTNFLAGAAEMRNLHMLTGDWRRNPTFTLFANPDYYLCATGFSCSENGTQVQEAPAFAWNHGDLAPDINTTWLGLVGPGVRHLGVDDQIWSDHTDDRPTLLALVGLKDDYRHQGRVLVEVLDSGALPAGIGDPARYQQLAEVFKQVNAGVGQFGLATLRASTAALESGGPGSDGQFAATTARLTDLGIQRDRLAAEMDEILDRPVSVVGTDGHRDDAAVRDLQRQGLDLLLQAWLGSGE